MRGRVRNLELEGERGRTTTTCSGLFCKRGELRSISRCGAACAREHPGNMQGTWVVPGAGRPGARARLNERQAECKIWDGSIQREFSR